VDRLIHIISLCPAVAAQALTLVVGHIFKLRDTNLYQLAVSAYEQVSSIAGVQLPPFSEIAPLDQSWADETTSKNQAERNKLEVELKTYTSNMIKESIRVGQYHGNDFL
jgi:COP9 signalosome complex subunit 1